MEQRSSKSSKSRPREEATSIEGAAALLNPDNHGPAWRLEDLAAMWHHQLATPFDADCGPFLTRSAGAETPERAPADSAVPTFAEVLHGGTPRIDHLRAVKDFAKHHLADGDPAVLPRPLALALYYGSVIAARTRCGERTTRLNDADLALGAARIARQPWLDEPTRGLLMGFSPSP